MSDQVDWFRRHLPDAPWTEQSLADLELAEAAQELAEYAHGMIPTGSPRGRSQWAASEIEDALRLRWMQERVVAATVVAQRKAGLSWEDIAEAAEITRQSAHAKWSAAERDFDTRYREGLHRAAHGGPTPGEGETQRDTVEYRARRLDEWTVRHREPARLDTGPTPVTDRLRRMNMFEESMYLSRLTGIVLDEYLAPPPELMLPITLRRAQLEEAEAEYADAKNARTLRESAAKSRAYARDLQAQIDAAATTPALDAPQT